ncbi:MAG: hypothetical protein ACP5VQ_06860 [Phycisphaerae bacterium]
MMEANSQHAAVAVGLIFFMFIVAVIGLGIAVAICWVLYSCLKRIPEPFRLQQPGLAFLLLIPLFNLVWNFFVYPPLAKSYKAYFDSNGDTSVGDCGYGIGLAYSICAALCVIPVINIAAGLATLVLLILYLIKAWNLRSRITDITGGSPITPASPYGQSPPVSKV